MFSLLYAKFFGYRKREMNSQFANSAKVIPLSALQYNDSRLETKYSLPPTYFPGYPNRFRIPYRKSHTPGMIEGRLLEFPENVFPRTRINPVDIPQKAVWVRSYDESMVRKV